jgi:hypothetical protein
MYSGATKLFRAQKTERMNRRDNKDEFGYPNQTKQKKSNRVKFKNFKRDTVYE